MSPQVTLEYIRFNHLDGAPPGAVSLMLRKSMFKDLVAPGWPDAHVADPNLAVAADPSPQWTASMVGMDLDGQLAVSRAAYRRDQIDAGEDPVIQACFRVQCGPGEDPQTVLDQTEVRAVVELSNDLCDVLGSVDPKALSTGVDDPCHPGDPQYMVLTFPLPHHDIDGVGSFKVGWQWQLGEAGGGGGWTDLAATRHRVNVVLGAPSKPWGQTLPYYYPWTPALDVACVGAAGATTAADATAALVEHLYTAFGHEYDSKYGHATYTAGCPMWCGNTYLNIYLTRWLGLWDGTQVNCTDCAGLLGVLGNVLGCGLKAVNIETFGYLNTVVPVGRQATNNPFNLNNPRYSPTLVMPEDTVVDRSYFLRHRFVRLDGLVYDATIKLDGVADPWLVKLSYDDYEEAVVDKNDPEEQLKAGGDPTLINELRIS